ncbi:oxidoreductase molybdopterin binding domain-containing protein [Ceratocystis lukuohia]|uniref:Nitrate reductase [NADPH] n=1 Tax=Ceratocystis lukuohia TaxID=2019550 RepID=A0ABR4MQF5_9PEZI
MATSLLSRFGRLAPRTSPFVRPCPNNYRRHLSNSIPRLLVNSNDTLSPSSSSQKTSSSSSSLPPQKPLAGGAVRTLTLLASGGLVAAGVSFTLSEPDEHLSDNKDSEADNDTREPLSLPRIHLAEVRKHDGNSGEPWITYKDKIYDITDWIAGHPGGDVILQAAGGSVEPYWNIFTIHKSPHVYEILEQYLIGYVHSGDLVNGKIPEESVEDPFSSDPARHADLRTLTAKPRNAESPAYALSDSFQTPNDLFYVRNHFWVPVIEKPDEHSLTIELPDGESVTYSLAQLKDKFRSHTINATLQCSGNRRNHMTKEAGPTNGLQWTTGGISSATWTGVRLADVLADAGYPVASVRSGTIDPPEDAKHVHFSALEAYGASIPMSVAIDPRGDVLLAYEMNGEPIPRDHGYPLRALVPGHVAARSVKWLNKIVLSDEESFSQWQRKDYKSFGPNLVGKKLDWESAPSIQEMPVTSAITSAVLRDDTDADATSSKKVSVKGWAYSGGGKAITRVDVSLDGGATWDQAELLDDDRCNNTKENHNGSGRSWAWKRWEYHGSVSLAPAASTEPSTSLSFSKDKNALDKPFLCSPDIVVKATDENYNTQPQTQSSIYNARGNLATAWHRVRACERCTVKPSVDSNDS